MFVFHVILLPIVYAIQTHETFICRESVTVKAGEIAVIYFYMPSGYDEIRLTYEFEVSQGTIKYSRFHPIAFHSNISAVIDVMKVADPEWEWFFYEPENGVGGFTFTTTYSMSGEVHDSSEDLVDKTWDIFLYNEDSYDKEVTIDIIKIWRLL